MNRYLHCYAPVILGTIFGFILGYGFRYSQVEKIENNNLEPNNDKSELTNNN